MKTLAHQKLFRVFFAIVTICWLNISFAQSENLSKPEFMKADMDLKGNVLLVTSETKKQRRKYFYESADNQALRLKLEKERLKYYDKKGNLIYDEVKKNVLHWKREPKASNADFFYYTRYREPTLDSISIKYEYDENNNRIQSKMYRVLNCYLSDVVCEQKTFITDSVKTSNETITHLYDDGNNKIQTKKFNDNDVLMFKNNYEYDRNGIKKKRNVFEYDTLNKVISKKKYKYDNNNIVEFKFFEDNELKKAIVPEYDQNNNLKVTKEFKFYTNGSKQVSRIIKYDVNGNMTKDDIIFLQEPKITEYAYENNNLSEKIIRYKEDSTSNKRISYQYNKDKKISTIKHFDYQNELSEKYVTKYNKDGLKKEHYKINYYDEYKNKVFHQYYKYDSVGNWIEKFRVDYLYDSSYKYTNVKREIVYYQ